MDPLLIDADKALGKAKIALMSRPNSAFFTTVCFNLRSHWDSSIPTACTDGTELRFNPSFFIALTAEERLFLLLHETMHVAFMHTLRLGSKQHQRWNVAADHVINLMLQEHGFQMPAMGYADPQYKGMSVEQVYDLLPEFPAGSTFDGDLREPSTPPEEIQQEVQSILIQASIQSKMANDAPGSIPGEVQLFLDKLLNPKLPWHRILAKYVQALMKNDYSFRKPNRRFFPQYYLPSLIGNGMIDLAVGTDISSSVSDHEYHQQISEVGSIFKMMKPEKIMHLQFNTAITAIDKIRNIRELLNTKFVGRGGTDVTPVIQWAKKHKPQLLLIFTDGGFRFYDDALDYKGDVIWLIYNNPGFTAPYGKVIHYDIKDKS